jgi:hypothetical protein
MPGQKKFTCHFPVYGTPMAGTDVGVAGGALPSKLECQCQQIFWAIVFHPAMRQNITSQ